MASTPCIKAASLGYEKHHYLSAVYRVKTDVLFSTRSSNVIAAEVTYHMHMGAALTCKRVFTTSRGFVRVAEVHPAHSAEAVCTPRTSALLCGSSAVLAPRHLSTCGQCQTQMSASCYDAGLLQPCKLLCNLRSETLELISRSWDQGLKPLMSESAVEAAEGCVCHATSVACQTHNEARFLQLCRQERYRGHLLPDQLLVCAVGAPPDAARGHKGGNAHAKSPVQAQNALTLQIAPHVSLEHAFHPICLPSQRQCRVCFFQTLA